MAKAWNCTFPAEPSSICSLAVGSNPLNDNDPENYTLLHRELQQRVITIDYNHILSKMERNYCDIHRQLLAMVDSLKSFHHYLYERKFLSELIIFICGDCCLLGI